MQNGNESTVGTEGTKHTKRKTTPLGHIRDPSWPLGVERSGWEDENGLGDRSEATRAKV